eukprot:6178867-Pleurochrysis_carterae.AAC.1
MMRWLSARLHASQIRQVCMARRVSLDTSDETHFVPSLSTLFARQKRQIPSRYPADEDRIA